MLARVVIFLGSFLAFLIEPMAGRALLPHFGSGAGVWVTCLCAFQAFLVAGYACGAVVSGRRRMVYAYAALVVAAAGYTAFISPKCIGAFGADGAYGVGLSLAAAILPAFMLLSANATVVQSLCGGEYRLYAVSNAGSLAGLMAYALLVEPLVGMRTQWWAVAAGMGVYAVLLAVLNRKMGNGERAMGNGSSLDRIDRIRDGTGNGELPIPNSQLPNSHLLWIGLPFVGCATLTAATSHLTMDIAGLPLVWAVLLALYLLSWVVAFSSLCERHLAVVAFAGSAAVLVAAVASVATGAQPLDRFVWNAVGVGGLLSVGLAAIHGILYACAPRMTIRMGSGRKP